MAEPAMVHKHLFTPGLEAEGNRLAGQTAEAKKPTIDPKVKNEVVFTGVVIGPKGKIALCREAKDKNIRMQKREGDTIVGMTVKRIASNYMLLVDSEGKEIRLNVFQSDRKRPDILPPPTVQPVSHTPGDGVSSQPNLQPGASNAPAGQMLQGTASPSVQQREPVGNASDQNPQKNLQQQNNQRVNAFRQAIEQARQNAAGMVDQGTDFQNPFQQNIQKSLRP
uniref:Type II secretion system protein GspC N-terminal domain-containing protein n=1 Tax=Desulfatirhabdium butyrativorans TaxID=340467 RepID=A0A7C4W0K3_9BACT